MSFILDALKKSEKERALGAVSTLRSTKFSREGVTPLSWFLVSLVVITLVVALFGMKYLWKVSPQIVSSNPTADDLWETPVLTKPDSGTEQRGKAWRTRHDQRYPKPAELQDPVDVSDLDPSIQGRLSDLSINALSYSDNQSKRFVMINQSIFKEGDELGNGFSIEEITISSVIFKYGSLRIIMQP